MLRDVLSLGDKIDIRRIDRNSRPFSGAKTYVSQLVDFVEYDVIQIAAPIIYGKVILLEIGENYNLCFYTNKGLYQCNCVVLSNKKDNKTIISIVRIITNLEKYQRRQYYRLECIHDISYRVISTEEQILEKKLKAEDFRNNEERLECKRKLDQFDQEWLSGSAINISGGGVRFVSKHPHNQGENIRMNFELPIGNEMKKLALSARMISSNKIMTATGAFEHRVEFADIIQKDRDDLIKYIFEQERKRRRNDKV